MRYDEHFHPIFFTRPLTWRVPLGVETHKKGGKSQGDERLHKKASFRRVYSRLAFEGNPKIKKLKFKFKRAGPAQ